MGSCTVISEWNAFRRDPGGRIVQVENYKIPLNFGLWWPCVIKELLETMGHRTVSNWKTAVKLLTGQMMRNRNFRARNAVVEKEISNQEPQGKQSLRWEESGRVFSVESTWTMFPKETHAVSVMTLQLLKTGTVVREEKDDRLLPYSMRRQSRLATKKKIPTRKVEIRCRF